MFQHYKLAVAYLAKLHPTTVKRVYRAHEKQPIVPAVAHTNSMPILSHCFCTIPFNIYIYAARVFTVLQNVVSSISFILRVNDDYKLELQVSADRQS
jgi:hypothetical protein